MRVGDVVLDTAANGFAWVSTSSRRRFLWLTLLLRVRYGFARDGRDVVGPDEVLHRDFVRDGVCIHAGQDTWVGHYLLAADERSDAFLRQLHRDHCRS